MIPPELAPCGIYCGACPSFGKTCLGCASQELGGGQKRKSKWSCKLRVCCCEEKGLAFCSECEEYPCPKYRNKLTDSHPGDPRFTYRHEVEKNLILLTNLGQQAYLQHMESRFTCSDCSGKVIWYHYHCLECGAEVVV